MTKPQFNHASIKSFLLLQDDASKPLSRFDVFRLKNWMLVGNFLANIVAFILMGKLIFRGGPLPSPESMQVVAPMGDVFRGCATLAIALFVFADGIWETTNSDGHQFGKDRFKSVVQAYASKSAADIMAGVINEVNAFAGNSEKSDDVTLVIIKVEVQ